MFGQERARFALLETTRSALLHVTHVVAGPRMVPQITACRDERAWERAWFSPAKRKKGNASRVNEVNKDLDKQDSFRLLPTTSYSASNKSLNQSYALKSKTKRKRA